MFHRRWKQRYWTSLKYYRAGGPAFILVGGEGAESPGWLEAGALHDYALQNAGAMFILGNYHNTTLRHTLDPPSEHRYYGGSRPVADLTVKNLTWLSSHQALADISTFIVSMKEELGLTGPWLAIGGSYPGSLAGWLRLKYPHLIAGALAASGPVNAKPNFPEYLEVVDTALKAESEDCSVAVKRAVNKVISLTQNTQSWNKLGKMFRLCQPFDGSKAGLATLVETLLGNLETVVQYNRDKKTGPWSNVTTSMVCHIMTQEVTGSTLTRFSQLNDLSLKIAGSQCLDADYNNKSQNWICCEIGIIIVLLLVLMLRRTDYTDPISRVPGDTGNRQWLYQTCTEFGWYQSSDQHGGMSHDTSLPVDNKYSSQITHLETSFLWTSLSSCVQTYLALSLTWIFCREAFR